MGRNIRKEWRRLNSGKVPGKTGRAGDSAPRDKAEVEGAVSAILNDMNDRKRKVVELEERLIALHSAAAPETVHQGASRTWKPMAEKEAEFAKWEEELLRTTDELQKEAKKLDGEKKVLRDPALLERLRHIEDMDSEIIQMEADIKVRENKLDQRRDELREGERVLDTGDRRGATGSVGAGSPQERAHSGVQRLDDLLVGGLPIGCNVLVNGGKHTGKDVLARHMVASGLRRGVPVIWVLTDTDPASVRRDMLPLLPRYGELETQGLVKYVDLYSLDIGLARPDPLVTLISLSQQDVFQKLGQTVESYATDFLARGSSYRLVFHSLSTLMATVDARTALRFIMPFAGRRLREGAVSYYLVETGMHGEADIDLMEHTMDGSINLKTEQTKTFLSVKGIGDSVRSRAWINYTFTKTTFELGSFNLAHIK